MNRTTLMLPADLKARARERASEQGISLGELIRRSLASALEAPGSTRDHDALFGDLAVFSGETPADLAGDHDRYLYGSADRRALDPDP